jgi:hypothetical protein
MPRRIYAAFSSEEIHPKVSGRGVGGGARSRRGRLAGGGAADEDPDGGGVGGVDGDRPPPGVTAPGTMTELVIVERIVK